MNPNTEISPACRAEKSERVHTDLFAVCLTPTSSCPHQVNVDGLRLCFHPGRDQIIAQTDRAWYATQSQRKANAIAAAGT